MKYKVKSNLKHNGELYKKGDKVDLKENEAKQLLGDNVIAKVNDNVDDEDIEGTQPGVNEVSHEGNNANGKQIVKPGEPAKSEDDGKDDAGHGKYTVLKDVEFPKGKVHKVGDVIELTDEDAAKFDGKGLIEKVEDEEDKL